MSSGCSKIGDCSLHQTKLQSVYHLLFLFVLYSHFFGQFVQYVIPYFSYSNISKEGVRCANGCNPACTEIHQHFRCGHWQCFQSVLQIQQCIECGCTVQPETSIRLSHTFILCCISIYSINLCSMLFHIFRIPAYPRMWRRRHLCLKQQHRMRHRRRHRRHPHQNATTNLLYHHHLFLC